MDLKEIKQIIDLMSRNHLTEFELEKDGFKIHLKKDGAAVQHTISPMMSHAPQMTTAYQLPVQHSAHSVALLPSLAPELKADNLKEIVSPMVGTFYRSPSPESPSYVEVGTQVNEDTVVCIIEAMKVMNEIKAEVKGVITESLVESGKSVEFGKPLFKVKAL
ncbi:MAG: acetyl-CoA carboxylase biotin carboxyl carrier protein [Verrucomicrobiota bacterium]|nr:acetyl-CoA carboxylase biotin carboxyl carrier protein [Verrucomicrobiota bacterium]